MLPGVDFGDKRLSLSMQLGGDTIRQLEKPAEAGEPRWMTAIRRVCLYQAGTVLLVYRLKNSDEGLHEIIHALGVQVSMPNASLRDIGDRLAGRVVFIVVVGMGLMSDKTRAEIKKKLKKLSGVKLEFDY